ncbi:MAG: restriction endonuclease [Chloroflexi bacterium]|nr:restriction endonuclease [Chloroflexota bacterium]
MNITELRNEYHKAICEGIIRIQKSKSGEEYPNFADVGSSHSKKVAWGILSRISYTQNYERLKGGQTAGRSFEVTTREFIQESFMLLQHLRPGNWLYSTNNTDISNFDQYEHLAHIAKLLKKERALSSALGGNYIVGPDIVVSRQPVTDIEVNQFGILTDESEKYAKFTPLRRENYKIARPLLHAVISCKWTLRSDRAQNARTEALNLIRNRKGHLPHIVAVTAEPYPARIAALALGTGDLDCVYHFALPELIEAINETNDEVSLELLAIMVEGRRLRDISDLPFDLAI